MINPKLKARRPSPRELGFYYQQRMKSLAPPKSAIYHCDTPSPLTAVAEFDEMGGVLISYPGTVTRPANEIQLPPVGPREFGIPNELIVRMQQADSKKPVHIFILCADSSQLPVVTESLAATAKQENIPFDPNLIHFVPWDTDTYWTRDYGPWWVKNNHTGYYGVAKHVYTTLGGGSVGLVEGAEEVTPLEGFGIFRPNDDYAAVKLSDFLNVPIRVWNKAYWGKGKTKKKLPHIDVHDWYFTGLLDVGGNYMVTGDGIIASSYLVATQAELPEWNEVNQKHPGAEIFAERMMYILEQLNRFMGIKTYYVLTDPSETYIGHIDCWGKFLAPRKILIAESQDKAINEGYNQIAESFKRDKKEKFEIYRVMCQDIIVPSATPSICTTAAYTNSLILNDHVYVPIVGGNYKEYDENALAVYQKALPGYTIVGIIGKEDTPWLGTDAMHCRTRGIPRTVVENWLKSQRGTLGD